jgi:DNA polymerase (family 10)
MINQRGPMKLNMEKIIDACRVNKVAIEINSNPLRLDLSDRYARMVKEKGVKIVINSDGHDASQYQLLKYGIFVARRAWLTKDDVLNTKNLKQFLSFWE